MMKVIQVFNKKFKKYFSSLHYFKGVFHDLLMMKISAGDGALKKHFVDGKKTPRTRVHKSRMKFWTFRGK